MEKTLFFVMAISCLLFNLGVDDCSHYKYVITGVFTSLTLWYSYRLLIRPLDIQRKLEDVGFEQQFIQKQWASKDKLNQVRSMMRLKKQGALPPVYPNGWFSLLESDQINAEQVKYITALVLVKLHPVARRNELQRMVHNIANENGENFAVFRSSNGDINILNAYCSHLGANMAIGGIVQGNSLQCPFHGWIFNGKDGKCIQKTNDCLNVSAKTSVKRWESYEANGFIFVWYHAEKEEPSWYPPKDKMISNWTYRGRSEHYVNAHIQDIPENGADVTHLPMLHGDMALGGRYAAQAKKSLWKHLGVHKWNAKWEADEHQKHTSTLDLHHGLEIFGKFIIFKMNVIARQIGPGLVIMNFETSFGPLKLVQVVTPVEPLIQKVVHRIYCPMYLSLYATIVLFMEGIMFERDVVIWNHKSYVEMPLISKQELTLLKHRKWFKQFYSVNSHKLCYKRETMDW